MIYPGIFWVRALSCAQTGGRDSRKAGSRLFVFQEVFCPPEITYLPV